MDIYPADEIYIRCAEKFAIARQKFCNAQEFLEMFNVRGQKMLLNLMNVTCIDSETIRPTKLWNVIHELDDKRDLTNSFEQDLIEFKSLNFLLTVFDQFQFMKMERPDFILQDGEKLIGLEISSAISEVDARLGKVVKYNYGRGKKTSEIESYIETNHSRITEQIDIQESFGTTVLSSSRGLIDCHAYKEEINNLILKKANSIREFPNQYQEMWLLIDTNDNLCFSEKPDANQLAELLIGESRELHGLDKILVINIINKCVMDFDVKNLEFKFNSREK